MVCFAGTGMFGFLRAIAGLSLGIRSEKSGKQDEKHLIQVKERKTA